MQQDVEKLRATQRGEEILWGIFGCLGPGVVPTVAIKKLGSRSGIRRDRMCFAKSWGASRRRQGVWSQCLTSIPGIHPESYRRISLCSLTPSLLSSFQHVPNYPDNWIPFISHFFPNEFENIFARLGDILIPSTVFGTFSDLCTCLDNLTLKLPEV